MKTLFIQNLLVRLFQRFRSKPDFFSQSLVPLECGSYVLQSPSRHILIELRNIQPYRDLCIGITAKYIGEKYPSATFVDVGANIGDTAALMATYSSNKLILVEPSDYFYSLLSLNSKSFQNETILIKSLISDGSPVTGCLKHWGGTAFFDSESDHAQDFKTMRLCDISTDDLAFIKLDTDGFDFGILQNSINWLKYTKSAVLFENQIYNTKDLADSNNVLEKLFSIGYHYFLVWDDPGILLFASNSLDSLHELNYYLFKVHQIKHRISIFNYDILCLHERDHDIFHKVKRWFREH